ncbi:hypothetical protein ACFXKD_20660 [Nocardiopsis aegyptia]|uniref:hypothetical protein n=1 Tax=Nocardiopsis aegyptia TaxID=220378 RepID=UPI00366C6B61
MIDERRALRRVAPVLFTAVLALTACGSGGEEPASESTPTGADDEPQENTISPEELSGFLEFHGPSANQVSLTFHDVGDGTQKTQLDLTDLALTDTPAGTPVNWHHFAFSPDFRYTAFVSGGGLRFGELDPATYSYEWTADVLPEESNTFSGGAVEYLSPQFSPDGSQLWFEEQYEHGEEDSRVLSVDVTDPEAQPEHQGDVPRGSEPLHRFEEAGMDSDNSVAPDNAFAITDDNRLEVLEKVETGEEEVLQYLVGESTGIVPFNFVAGPSGQYFAPSDFSVGGFAEITSFSIADDGAVSDNETELQTPANNIREFWYDEAGDRLVLRSGDSFFTYTPGSGDEPEEAFTDLTYEEQLGNSNQDQILGIYPVHSG